MNAGELLSLALVTILAENVVLSQLWGVHPALNGSEKPGMALGVGLCVTLISGLTAVCAWFFNTYLLAPYGLDKYLQTILFVLTAAALTRLLDIGLRVALPRLRAFLGGQLPMIAVNCSVLGVALQNAQRGYGALASAAHGVFVGLGFTLAAILLASVRARLEFAECPKAFEGVPIVLVSAGLLAMAFMGFSGLHI